MIIQLDSDLTDRLTACAASQDRQPEDVIEELVRGWLETAEPAVIRDDSGEVIGNSEEIDDLLFEARFNEWRQKHGDGGESFVG